MKKHRAFWGFAALLLSAAVPAQASDFKHNYQLCMASYKHDIGHDFRPEMIRTFGSFEKYWQKEGQKIYGPGCRQWAQHPDPNQLAYDENKYGNGHHYHSSGPSPDVAAGVLGSFLSGFTSGVIGTGMPLTPQGAGAFTNDNRVSSGNVAGGNSASGANHRTAGNKNSAQCQSILNSLLNAPPGVYSPAQAQAMANQYNANCR